MPGRGVSVFVCKFYVLIDIDKFYIICIIMSERRCPNGDAICSLHAYRSMWRVRSGNRPNVLGPLSPYRRIGTLLGCSPDPFYFLDFFREFLFNFFQNFSRNFFVFLQEFSSRIVAYAEFYFFSLFSTSRVEV